MADALCGPSNALQNFQKHTAVDRTLQQDRLVNRHPAAQQNFRSQHPNAATLDPEFEAFENNFAANGPQLGAGGAFGAHTPHHQPLPTFSSPDNLDWASDFQKLQVSGLPQNIVQHQAAVANSRNGWQDEFVQHQQHQSQQNIQPHFQQPGPMASYQPHFMPTYSGMNGMVASPTLGQGSIQATQSLDKVSISFDESAFEAAFNQAQADIHEQELASSEHQKISEEEDVRLEDSEPALETESKEEIRIGSDLIGNNNTEANIQEQQNDSDELAKTAGHLLDSLSHDNSQKFKESNFLALMRRIRDREVHLEGDEFRETTQPLHPGGSDYPGGRSSSNVDGAHSNAAKLAIHPE